VRKAVFLDRDGTLIEHVHYLSRPDQVRLIPGVAGALREIEALGYLRIMVTNQAAIAKGLITISELESIHAELARQLAQREAALDATYFCPVASESDDRERIEHPDRKPGPGMLIEAAREHGIDLARSVMVGDMVSDTLAGRHAGCALTVLVGEEEHSLAARTHSSVDHYLSSIAGLPELLRELESG